MKNKKKYELTDDIRILRTGETIHRIRALRDFGSVKKGELGGYVESEFNLSHAGNAWIYGVAKVFNRARVIENGKVMHNAKVCDKAIVSKNAVVGHNAQVSGRAILTDFASVMGHAVVCERAIIKDNVNLFGRACVRGEAVAGTHFCLGGESYVSGKSEYPNDIITVGPIGPRADTLIAHLSKNREDIELTVGLFQSPIKEFTRKVFDDYQDNNLYLDQYLTAIAFIKLFFKINMV